MRLGGDGPRLEAPRAGCAAHQPGSRLMHGLLRSLPE